MTEKIIEHVHLLYTADKHIKCIRCGLKIDRTLIERCKEITKKTGFCTLADLDLSDLDRKKFSFLRPDTIMLLIDLLNIEADPNFKCLYCGNVKFYANIGVNVVQCTYCDNSRLLPRQAGNLVRLYKTSAKLLSQKRHPFDLL